MVAGVISSPANARTSLTAPRHADAAAGPLALLKLKNVKRREKLKKKRIRSTQRHLILILKTP